MIIPVKILNNLYLKKTSSMVVIDSPKFPMSKCTFFFSSDSNNAPKCLLSEAGRLKMSSPLALLFTSDVGIHPFTKSLVISTSQFPPIDIVNEYPSPVNISLQFFKMKMFENCKILVLIFNQIYIRNDLTHPVFVLETCLFHSIGFDLWP